jgi:hypothetical protein
MLVTRHREWGSIEEQTSLKNQKCSNVRFFAFAFLSKSKNGLFKTKLMNLIGFQSFPFKKQDLGL